MSRTIWTRKFRSDIFRFMKKPFPSRLTCNVCGKTKRREGFYDHLPSRCKECHKAQVTKNRKKNAEYYLDYDRKRAFRPDRVAARKDYQERKKSDQEFQEKHKIRTAEWRQRNKIKYAAHTLLNNSLKSGDLVKPKICSECGKKKKVHGHHDDYSKPLEVRWLCQICHGNHHRRFDAQPKGN